MIINLRDTWKLFNVTNIISEGGRN